MIAGAALRIRPRFRSESFAVLVEQAAHVIEIAQLVDIDRGAPIARREKTRFESDPTACLQTLVLQHVFLTEARVIRASGLLAAWDMTLLPSV